MGLYDLNPYQNDDDPPWWVKLLIGGVLLSILYGLLQWAR